MIKQMLRHSTGTDPSTVRPPLARGGRPGARRDRRALAAGRDPPPQRRRQWLLHVVNDDNAKARERSAQPPKISFAPALVACCSLRCGPRGRPTPQRRRQAMVASRSQRQRCRGQRAIGAAARSPSLRPSSLAARFAAVAGRAPSSVSASSSRAGRERHRDRSAPRSRGATSAPRRAGSSAWAPA